MSFAERDLKTHHVLSMRPRISDQENDFFLSCDDISTSSIQFSSKITKVREELKKKHQFFL